MDSLADLKNLQTEASNLYERLDSLSDNETGQVRRQMVRLSNLAFERYTRRRRIVSEQVKLIWGKHDA